MAEKYTVLIVDDTEHNIDLMSDMLRDSYNIMTAEGGAAALEILHAKDARPDIVLLDMLMPKPDGYDVLKEMQNDEALRSIPVVVVTADDDPNAQARSFELGAVDFVPRGANMNMVRQRVKSVIHLCELDKMRRENERLRHEIALELRLSALMDNLPGGVATIRTGNNTAECTYCNSQLLELFRMSMEQFIMQFAMPVLPGWIKKLISSAQNEEQFTFEFAVNGEGDGFQWLRLSANVTEMRGETREFHCVFLDINSEKKHALRAEENDRKLRENRDHLDVLINNAPGGILFAERLNGSEKFRVSFVNEGFAEMMDYTDREKCLEDFEADPFVGLNEQDVSVIREEIYRTADKTHSFRYGFKRVSQTGEEIYLKMSCQTMPGEDGKIKLYAFITNLTNEKRYQDELRQAAYFDPLTGLYNRLAFMVRSREVIDENPYMRYSLMVMNIGSFKIVNDLLGRDVGDKVLMTIADSLRGLVERDGVFARLFSDNFAIITPYSERGIHPRTLLQTVQRAVDESGLVSHEIQYYIGVYTVTDRSLSIESMTDRAALACRSINGSYMEHIAFYDEKMRLKILEDQQICDEAPNALKNGEFCVYYQPVYGINAGKFVSAEALVRWKHPEKGMISPGKFIPVFEKNGFIAELDLYVLEQVCKLMKRRWEAGLPEFPISVNISRMSLYDAGLFETISRITDSYGIDPKHFRIEITESAYNDNPAQLLETISKLRGKGYPVLMDDFGSGYSSLNTLKDIPIDVLKLDMKFMQGFETNVKVGTIVTSVARMAKWLNIPMLAEGVETKEQFDFLQSIGCYYIQGFYFSRPVPEEEFTKLIELEAVTGDSIEINHDMLGNDINEILGSSALVSKLISGAFGGFGIYEMYDGKLEAVRVNPGYLQIKGYTNDDFNSMNLNVWDTMLPGDAEKSKNACLEAMKTDSAVRATVRTLDKNGKTIYLDGIHRRLGGTDEEPIFCIAFNDITDSLEAEKQTIRTKMRMDEILNATETIAVDYDFENNSTLRIGDMSDYTLDDVEPSDTDNPFMLAVHPDDLEKAQRFYTAKSEGKKSEELRIKRKSDGKYYWWKFTDIPTYNEDGSLKRLMGMASNIDDEKRAKMKLGEENRFIKTIMDRHFTGILIMRVLENGEMKQMYSNDSFWRIIARDRCSLGNIFKEEWFGLNDDDRLAIRKGLESGKTRSLNLRTSIVRGDGKKSELELIISLLTENNEEKRRTKAYSIFVTEIG